MGKIFFSHYSIKIIGNFLICFLLLNWFFSIKFIRSFSNRKMSIINRKNSIKFQNIWQNSICYKALCCQKVKVQNWSSWLSWLWLSLKSCSSWSSWSSGQTGKPGQTGQTGQTDLTFKLDFPGNLCRTSFANFALFHTGYGMDYSLNLGRERAAHKLIAWRHHWG